MFLVHDHIFAERDRLTKVIEMSGITAAEVEMKVTKREADLNIRIQRMEEEVQRVIETVSEVSQRVFNMDTNKKNNLIFNGIIQEEGETKVGIVSDPVDSSLCVLLPPVLPDEQGAARAEAAERHLREPRVRGVQAVQRRHGGRLQTSHRHFQVSCF